MKKTLLTIAALWCGIHVQAKHNLNATEINEVVLNAERSVQSNVYGINLVDELSTKIYKQILDGTLPLYENQQKKFIIKPSSLLNFEKKTKNNFKKCHELWVYEKWTTNNYATEAQTDGIAFVSRGQYIDVMFGYVDYEDIQRVLKTYYPEVDYKGYSNINIVQYFKAKLYDFKIAKYNKREIHSKFSSERLKDKFAQNNYSNSESTTLKKSKTIDYKITFSDILKNSEENILLKSFEYYLKNNPEAVLNLGGENTFNYLGGSNIGTNPDAKLEVTGMIVKEEWSYNATKGIMEYEPISIKLVLNNDIILDEIAFKSMKYIEDEVYLDNGYVASFLKSKSFLYHVQKINNRIVNDLVNTDRILINKLSVSNTWTEGFDYDADIRS